MEAKARAGGDLLQITASLGPLGVWPWMYLSELLEGPEDEGLLGLPQVSHLILSGPDSKWA